MAGAGLPDVSAEPQPQDGADLMAPFPQALIPLLHPDLAAQDARASTHAAADGVDKDDGRDTDSDALPVTPDMTAQMALMMPPPARPAQSMPAAPAMPQDGESVDGVDESPSAAGPVQSRTPDGVAQGDVPPAAAQNAASQANAAQPDVARQTDLPAPLQQMLVAQPASKQAEAQKSTGVGQTASDAANDAEETMARSALLDGAKPLSPKTLAKTAMANTESTNPLATPHGHGADVKTDTASDAPRVPQADAAPPPAPPQSTASQPPANLVGPLVVSITEPSAISARNAGPEKANAADGPQPDMDALAVQIAAKSQSGSKQFDIRLDPPELGRVDVRLSIDSGGKAQAHLTADQPQTLDLLQKDASTLTRALRDAGLDVSQNGLNFSLRGQNGGGNSDSGMSGRGGRRAGIPVDSLKRIDAGNPVAAQWRGPVDGRLDIRV